VTGGEAPPATPGSPRPPRRRAKARRRGECEHRLRRYQRASHASVTTLGQKTPREVQRAHGRPGTDRLTVPRERELASGLPLRRDDVEVDEPDRFLGRPPVRPGDPGVRDPDVDAERLTDARG